MIRIVIVYRFGARDLLRTRFAISPLTELAHSLRVLGAPADHSVHAVWVRAAARRAAGLELELPLLLTRRGTAGYAPDFLAPPPRSPRPAIADELARLRAAEPDAVAREVAWRFEGEAIPGLARPLLEDPERALTALADALAAYWNRVLAPDWPRVLGLLEDDVARRAAALARSGGEAAFADLHERATFFDGALRVERAYDATVDLGGEGLTLLPSAFAWPDVACYVDPPWPPAVLYPARGVGELWVAGAAEPSAALGELLGRRRARVLLALRSTATTSELAGALALPASSVSEHLSVLRASGLVRARRDGRAVRYARTPLGDRLAEA